MYWGALLFSLLGDFPLRLGKEFCVMLEELFGYVDGVVLAIAFDLEVCHRCGEALHAC